MYVLQDYPWHGYNAKKPNKMTKTYKPGRRWRKPHLCSGASCCLVLGILMIRVITSLDTNAQFLKQLSQGIQKVAKYDPFKGEKNKQTRNCHWKRPDPWQRLSSNYHQNVVSLNILDQTILHRNWPKETSSCSELYDLADVQVGWRLIWEFRLLTMQRNSSNPRS